MSNLILKQLSFLQKQKQSSNFWNITWDQGVFISNLVKISKPKKILEIGTSNGFSTLWLALNLDKDSQIHTIEINKERLNIAKSSFKQAQINNIKTFCGDIFKLTNNELKQTKPYDMLFIDAQQDSYKKLLDNLEQNNFLKNNSIILFDNILNHDSTKKFVENLNPNLYTKEIIDIGSGMLFLKYFSK